MATEVSFWQASDQASKVCSSTLHCFEYLLLHSFVLRPRHGTADSCCRAGHGIRQEHELDVRLRLVRVPPSTRCRPTLTPRRRSCTVVYSNFSPLVIILVGSRGVSAGLLHALLPEIRLKLENVRGVVGSA